MKSKVAGMAVVILLITFLPTRGTLGQQPGSKVGEYAVTLVGLQEQSSRPDSTPCTLTLEQSPAIRGIKLRMSVQELFAAFPGSAENGDVKSNLALAEKNFGVAGFYLDPSLYPTKDRFAGISSYLFRLLDGRIVLLGVNYIGPPEGPEWQYNVDDFIAKFAEAFHLPPAGQWLIDQTNPEQKSLKCNGFRMNASRRGSLYLSVTSPDWSKELRERKAAYEEKKRRQFKPEQILMGSAILMDRNG